MRGGSKRILFWEKANFALRVFLSLYLFIIPTGLILYYLCDPALKTGDIPRIVLNTHKSLTQKYEPYLKDRLSSDKAAQVSNLDVAGTEWPFFGTAFYLWSTENIEAYLKAKGVPASELPSFYARKTIALSSQFLHDPRYARWVRNYWGESYLTKENLFFRTLLISGDLANYQMLHDSSARKRLIQEADSLGKEIDGTKYGLLDDYPQQCYPVDISATVAILHHAHKVLKENDTAFVSRAIRAFQGSAVDPHTGLSAYNVDSLTGIATGPSRGTGISYMLIWSPELWPENSKSWYTLWDKYFYQDKYGICGYREFAKGVGPDWWYEVDAGPLIAGNGVAASAFGLGAARANGQLDHVFSIETEAIVGSWPLLDGSLLGPRILSNMANAPLLGESAMLFLMSVPLSLHSDSVWSFQIPPLTYILVGLIFLFGVFFIAREVRELPTRLKKSKSNRYFLLPLQFICYAIILLYGLIDYFVYSSILGLFIAMFANIFPIGLAPGRKAKH